MGSNFSIGFFDPPIPFSSSNQVKTDAPLLTATSREISISTLGHEIVRVNIDWTGSALSSDVVVTCKWFNSDTGALLFTSRNTWQAGWNWAWVKSWIGHKSSGEIDRAGNYRVEILSSLWGIQVFHFKITEPVAPPPPIPEPPIPEPPVPSVPPEGFEVVLCSDPRSVGNLPDGRCFAPIEVPPEEPSWWDKFLELIKGTKFAPWSFKRELIQIGYELLTGVELSDEEYEIRRLEIIDLIIPINVIHKLFFGTNIQGEDDEFGSADDYIQLVLGLALFIPAGKLAAIGSKLFGRIVSKSVVSTLTVKAGDVVAAKAIVDALEKSAVKFGEGFLMMPPGVQTGILKGIGREVSERTVFTPMKLLVDYSSRVGVKAEVGLLYDELLGKSLTSAIKRGLTSGEIAWLAARVGANPLRAAEMFIKTPKNWNLLGSAGQKAVLDSLAASTEVYSTTIAGNLAKQLGITVGASTLKAGGVISKLFKVKTIMFGVAGILGLISMAYGIPFGTSWMAKEGLKEVFEIPLADRMREYRREPTPELLAIIRSSIAKVEESIPIAEKLINSVSWLWPWTKEGWDFYVENLSFEIDNIKAELAIEEPPIPEPPVPPPEEPPEPPPPEPPEEIVPIRVWVSVRSRPEGAAIMLDGETTYQKTNYDFLMNARVNPYYFQLSSPKGYDNPSIKTVYVDGSKNLVVDFGALKILEPGEEPEPLVPVPIEVPLEPIVPVVVKPNAWEYTITARDVETGSILSAKIIVDGIFTGKYTTNKIVLEPEAEYLLRLEAFGYEVAEVIIKTEALPG